MSYVSFAKNPAHHGQDDLDELLSSQLLSFITGMILSKYTNLKGELEILCSILDDISPTASAISIHQMIYTSTHQHGTPFITYTIPKLIIFAE